MKTIYIEAPTICIKQAGFHEELRFLPPATNLKRLLAANLLGLFQSNQSLCTNRKRVASYKIRCETQQECLVSLR